MLGWSAGLAYPVKQMGDRVSVLSESATHIQRQLPCGWTDAKDLVRIFDCNRGLSWTILSGLQHVMQLKWSSALAVTVARPDLASD